MCVSALEHKRRQARTQARNALRQPRRGVACVSLHCVGPTRRGGVTHAQHGPPDTKQFWHLGRGPTQHKPVPALLPPFVAGPIQQAVRATHLAPGW